MSSWPDSLPVPLRADYSLEAGDPTARTDMESGPARVRQRSTRMPDKVPLSFLLDESQMATFRSFWKTDFMHGAAWVTMPIRDGRTAGISQHECRPTSGKFKAVLKGPISWVVSFEVEVRYA
jgi:hypothetical protein